MMIEKLREIIQRHEQLARRLADPEVVSDPKTYAALAKEHSDLGEVATRGRTYVKLSEQLDEDEDILLGDDTELKALVSDEIQDLKEQLAALEEELKILMLPGDPDDNKNTIVEIRGGTGGEEAALFAADLFRMYTRYAERKGWAAETLSTSEAESGGFKEVIFSVKGKGAYGDLKYESGVHRVQRVPVTESSGRIHTSAASVAVLPEIQTESDAPRRVVLFPGGVAPRIGVEIANRRGTRRIVRVDPITGTPQIERPEGL